MRSICIALIRVYRFCISPFLGNCCRFYPTCSHYAQEAFTTHSLSKAFYLTGKRILRCHPFCEGGVDLVPGGVSDQCECEEKTHTHTHTHTHTIASNFISKRC